MFEGIYQADYWISRYIIQRGMGLIYLIAFITAFNQFRPLLGENGLMPVPEFLKNTTFKQFPGIFQWHYSDRLFGWVSGSGIFLSLLALFGFSDAGPIWLSMLIWLLLWALYLSIVNAGQIFYGFGWESLLLEAGFYVIFLGPLHYYAPLIMIFILRWLVFRVEFGAGLIKMRGDKCWRNLTCLNYHHETQPLPNPFSRFFHNLPESIHKFETLSNHAVQLGVVWLLFAPQPIASYAAVLIVLSQGYLIISGNYAWLNLLTLLLAFSGFSDSFLQQILTISPPAELASPVWFMGLSAALAAVVIYLSIDPVKNMISPAQRMNASFNNLHLVNTYGAFGSVTKERREIVVEGTTDEQIDEKTEWKPYEFKGKPTDPGRQPPQVAPYHLRLDWQMWFAAMRDVRMCPWFIKFVKKLLQNQKSIAKLLKTNPFEMQKPTYIRARLYIYRFTTPEEKRETGQWWHREYQHDYLPPKSLDDLSGLDL
ncbi:lipase maturation factor family protein [Rhodohalobacter sp. 8-1]|uniref:lipase maturation factor family protein n=1 Tax=Rhodohalobacter sp. 8-1 TaxID=3131972 RepID=UPI0030EC1F16